VNSAARQKAQEFSSKLDEKKPGLFLVSGHPAQATVWLDCRDGGIPRLYAYTENDEELSDLRETRPVKAVKAAARSQGCARLDGFGGETSE